MNILYVSSNYVPASGGSELSDATAMKNLAKRGHRIKVVTFSDTKDSIEDKNPQIYRITNKNPTNFLEQLVKKQKPDIIYTCLGWSRQAIKLGKEINTPTVLNVSSLEYGQHICEGKPFAPDYIITPSNFSSDRIKEETGRQAIVIPPCIDFSRFYPQFHKPKYVTLINPVKEKGADIFYELAKRIPNIPFLTKAGWVNLKRNGKWNIDRLELIAESLGDELVVPVEEKPPVLSNLYFIYDEKDISWVYNNTSILLSPSICEETFGMTNVEAMYHGIPVIGSKRGGIPEAMNGAGILIDKPENVDSWEYELKNILNDADKYKKLVLQSKKRIEKYNLDEIIDKIERAFEKIKSSYKF